MAAIDPSRSRTRYTDEAGVAEYLDEITVESEAQPEAGPVCPPGSSPRSVESGARSAGKTVAESGRRVFEKSKDKLSAASQKLRAGGQRGVDAILDAVETGRARGKQRLQMLKHEIEARPMACVGICFAVGMIIGGLIRWGVRRKARSYR